VPLALVPNPQVIPKEPRALNFGNEILSRGAELDVLEGYGSQITTKPANTLRISFQNIGGFSTKNNSLKDDIIRSGLQHEELDSLRCRCVAEAERKCRKLRVGQVAFSPELQKVRRDIAAWKLLLKKSKGLKVSSRFLDRTLKKSNISPSARSLDTDSISEKLVKA
jgi:hypothetical protein